MLQCKFVKPGAESSIQDNMTDDSAATWCLQCNSRCGGVCSTSATADLLADAMQLANDATEANVPCAVQLDTESSDCSKDAKSTTPKNVSTPTTKDAKSNTTKDVNTPTTKDAKSITTKDVTSPELIAELHQSRKQLREQAKRRNSLKIKVSPLMCI